ncbi:hypothetical protein DPMN_065512 [Dreissena polymorpha]|uniref:Uncharacterized protein n=1 Tax=Dreissena polymorpha TaxID=45954 RepID=A0A9D3YTP6_DREPO|nr:hypothetical protein DPMN_065512 [Dreissena polymorpha]
MGNVCPMQVTRDTGTIYTARCWLRGTREPSIRPDAGYVRNENHLYDFDAGYAVRGYHLSDPMLVTRDTGTIYTSRCWLHWTREPSIRPDAGYAGHGNHFYGPMLVTLDTGTIYTPRCWLRGTREPSLRPDAGYAGHGNHFTARCWLRETR